jgi:hypothetical protein
VRRHSAAVARIARRILLLAVALAAVHVSTAAASQFGMEGGEAVVRFDPGERIQLYHSLSGPSRTFRVEANAATGVVTATNDIEQPLGIVSPGADPNRWGLIGPRVGTGCSQGTGRTVACPLARVQRIRIEFGLASGPIPRASGNVIVQAGTLPVVVNGGPNGNFAAVITTGP